MKFGFLSHLDLNLYRFRTPIMQALIKQGHTVYAICPPGDKNTALAEVGCHIVNYNIDRKGLNPFKEKQSIDNIYRAIKDLDLDLLHTFTAKPNIYGTFAARKANVPVVLNLVEGLGSYYTDNTIGKIAVRTVMEHLYKKAFRLSDGCVFVNRDDPAYMVRKGMIRPEQVKLIRSVGVDTRRFDIRRFPQNRIEATKRALGLEGKTIVLMVARAIWDKGVREYYEAAEHLSRKFTDTAFVLVGDTDEGNPSCADASYLRTGKVQWLGHRDDIEALTAASDVYVLPSYREGVPVTLLEAASMSKPIVTTDTVGCREVVEDGINGFLVPIRDSLMLATRIETLLRSPELRRQFGKEGRKKAETEFDVNKVVDQYLTYYDEVLHGKKNF